jgi:hypothetical protein
MRRERRGRRSGHFRAAAVQNSPPSHFSACPVDDPSFAHLGLNQIDLSYVGIKNRTDPSMGVEQ